MVNASRGYADFFMMNKSLRALARRVQPRRSRMRRYGFQRDVADREKPLPGTSANRNFGKQEPRQKKSRRFRRLLKVDNREASNRVDRSHSVSKEGQSKS
jgi:hypothetical protein